MTFLRANLHVLGVSLLLFAVVSAGAQSHSTSEGQFTTAPAAEWVKRISVDTAEETKSTAGESETRELLFDRQVNVRRQERFVHIARKILNDSGVQNYSKLIFDFDPAYEKLILHSVHIRRGTSVLDRLDPKKINVIQQEKDLDRHLYDGTLSAVLFVEDVRVGDVLEYASTVQGFNPVMDGRYIDSFYVQWGIPTGRSYYRILPDPDHPLVIKNHNTDIQPAVADGRTEYIWDIINSPALEVDGSTPIWFDAYPWVELTEFKNWEKVATWADKFYQRPQQLSSEMTDAIARWKASYTEEEDRVVAALQFVQDEVRYLGIEFGVNSHRPTDPNVVFARRFGDCKDKTFLLCTLLRALEIDAAPALVNTVARHTIDGRVACPTAFNHVVTEVRLKNKTCWIDPTRSYQRGPLSTRFFPNYGRALLVRPGVTDLSVIPLQTNGFPKTVVDEKFVVKGKKDPVLFSITTLMEGRDADRLREELAAQGREALEKNYLNYYARAYPSIETTVPLKIEDLPLFNKIKLVEQYRIKEFWILSEDKKQFEAEFYPQPIRDFFDVPSTTIRKVPLGFPHPQQYTLRTEVIFAEEWPLKNSSQKIEDVAFNLTTTQRYRSKKLTMAYEYRSLTDVVETNQLSRHLKNLDRARNALGYSLTWANDESPASPWQPNWLLFTVGGLFLIPLIGGAFYVTRIRIESLIPPIPMYGDEKLVGLGGWLLLVGLGITLTPVRVAYGMFELREMFSLSYWHSLTVPGGESYHALWMPAILTTLVGNLALLIFAIVLNVLFYQKRSHFPRVYICFLIFNAALLTLDNLWLYWIPGMEADPTARRDLSRTYMACLIWIPYMVQSRRVKLTFTR